jgi:putative transposase
MLVNQAFRYELKPNNKQISLLVKHCGVARFAWNWALARRIELYKTREGKDRFTSAISQHKELNALKQSDFPWMYDVSKCAPQSALQDLDKAYSNMIRRIKNHEYEIGRPKFKKKGVHDSFRLTGAVKVKDNLIQLPRIGDIRTKEPTHKFAGNILSATVSREADRWYCSLCVEVNRPEPQPIQGDIVGIDLGINCFATISDGKTITEIHSPKPLRKNIKKLKKLHRELSRKKKGSKNKREAQLRLARLYRKIKNIRQDFLAKETSRLAKTKSVIIIEDLNISGMVKNHHLARSIGDEGWGDYGRMLGYKTHWYGSRLLKIPRFYPSSKRCNHCGVVNKELKLSDRTWVCLNCGAVNERDPNAAHNIRECGIGILNTESLSEFQACGVDVRLPKREAIGCEAGIKHICYK